MSFNQLRIAHYLPTIRLADGGIARAVLDWCKVFADRGHQVWLICHDALDVPREWVEHQPGYPKAVVTGPHKLVMSLPEMQVLGQIDVLHLHAPWLISNLRFARAARRCGVPYVVSIHGMLDDWSMSQRSLKKRMYLLLLGRRFLNQAATVHCTAEAELTQASRWFDNPRTAVLPCLMDLSPFENLPGPDLALKLLPSVMVGDQKMLFMGRLHEKKGVDVAIRATYQLRSAGVQVVLLIAGIGEANYEKKLRDLIQELNLSDQVLFLGLITGQTKLSLYQAADLFVLPTQQENFGMVLIEAMACGTPVLTTRGTDIWKELQTAGGVIADRTAGAFAEQARKLLKDSADRAERSARARQWVLSALAVEPLTQKYESLYRSVIRP